MILNIKKSYLFLGLLLSISSLMETKENTNFKEQTNHQHIQKTIDDELLQIFKDFFNEKDQTPFSETISKIIQILKTKKQILHGASQTKYEKLIKDFEKNKFNNNFSFWVKMLVAPDLIELMSPEVRTYLQSISPIIKIQALRNKLQK